MYSQVRNKNFFSEKSSRVSTSTLIHMLNTYYLKETGADIEKMKRMGEQMGPRIYESMQYFKENKFSKRCKDPEEAMRFIGTTVCLFLADLDFSV